MISPLQVEFLSRNHDYDIPPPYKCFGSFEAAFRVRVMAACLRELASGV